MKEPEFRVQLRDLDEDLVFPLVRLAETGQTELTVYLDEAPIVSSPRGRAALGVANVRSGFLPLTLDQVAEFCHNDVVEIRELGRTDDSEFVRLVDGRCVALLDLYVSLAAVESVRRMVTPGAAKPATQGTLSAETLQHLAERERELLDWAKRSIDFAGTPRPTKLKTVPKIAHKASALGFRDPQTRAKWVWGRLNPHKKPGAPPGPRELKPRKK